ncbi:hypothetical protein HB364_09645 [Pseudoflavitalea sp. X16]|uniref:hypothetical protein n=1 Tax=Paraflavitalea devenefica TaxID=2716334 RepID=UPI0014239978|nr:hypothetical protein [Paraflavitalea devenefica]NII25344.1 hypothetical protein [Paraflavitalea devenefica]
MNVKKTITIIGVAGLLVVTSLVLANTTAIKNKKWWNKTQAPQQAVESERGKKDPAQFALLAELAGWLKPFDSTNTAYAYEALLTAIDKTDSAHAMTNVDYRFRKNRQQFYLRVGRQETINTDQFYLVADHDAQRIILRAAKHVAQVPGIQLNALYNYLRGEGYTLKKKTENGLPVIAMSNPYHISCKEFTVQYDSAVRQVKKIFFRQADIADHMDPSLEKWVTLVFKKWDDDPESRQFPRIQDFVTSRQGKWISTPAYQDYELMVR